MSIPSLPGPINGDIMNLDHMDALARIDELQEALDTAITLIEGLMGSDFEDSETVKYLLASLEGKVE